MPLAAYMVSSMSSTSRRTASSTPATGSALVRSRGSGYSRIASFVMGVMRWISCFWPTNIAKVPPLLNLMPIAEALEAPANGKTGRYVRSLWRQAGQYTSRAGTARPSEGSETNATSSENCPTTLDRSGRGMPNRSRRPRRRRRRRPTTAFKARSWAMIGRPWKPRSTCPEPRLPRPPAAQAPQSGVALAPNAPESYTVKRGDTLWGIAKVFLRDPWFWPEIWQVNPQVKNPHWIYPGDTLRLVYIDGQPKIVLQPGLQRGDSARVEPRVRSQPLEAAVTTIPYETIAAFMSKPSVLEKDSDQGRALRARHPRSAHRHVGRRHSVCARLQEAGRTRHALQRGSRRRRTARSGRQHDTGIQRPVHRNRPRDPRRRPGDPHHDRIDARDLPRRQAAPGRRRRAARFRPQPAEEQDRREASSRSPTG